MSKGLPKLHASDAVERLAAHLHAAYLEAYCAENPIAFRQAPGWEQLNDLGRVGWRKVAARLHARGVLAPLAVK